jgi:cyclohexa-1,5-dienecarbonyl-CoA hydratase
MTLLQNETAAQTVRIHVLDDVGYLTLDRPPLNVLTIAMMRELSAALEAVASQPRLRAIVLRGAGRAFSAGVDVGEHQPATVRELLAAFDDLIVRLWYSHVPVAVAVQGLALGGGFELALAADLLLVAKDARLGVPEIKLGVFPPAAAVLLPRLIGVHRAMELILTGEPITGAEAARIGLANRAVPAAQLDGAVEELLKPLHGASAVALRLARKAVVSSQGLELSTALQALKQVQLEELIPSHDAQEGLSAFLDKRAPVWEHR